jgi:hypothetical protein
LRRSSPFRFNLVIVLATFAVQAFLAGTPFIPLTAGFWHANSPQDLNNRIAAFLGIQLLFVTTAIALILMKGSQDQSDGFSDMRSALPLTVVKRLTDSQFYNEFLYAVREAQHSVRIAYLAPYPPSDVRYEHRKKYDKEILELMKERTNITFKRLIRDSPRNHTWVADLIRALKDKPNIEISLLKGDLSPENGMGLAMSVQVVDENKAWLVALRTHEIEDEFRDIYIENPDVTTGLTAYYDRIWEASTQLLDRGRITEEGEALLRKFEET